MQRLALFLLLCLAVTACGQNPESPDAEDVAARAKASVAVNNLKRIRDAVVKFRKATGETPASLDDLASHGADVADLEDSEIYSEFGYNFVALLFDDAGNLTRGWFFATPRADQVGLQVRMNGVNDNVEYLEQGRQWHPAEDDNDWREMNGNAEE